MHKKVSICNGFYVLRLFDSRNSNTIFYYEAQRSNKTEPAGITKDKKISAAYESGRLLDIFYYGVVANRVRGELCSPEIQDYHGESTCVCARNKRGRTACTV